MRLWHYKLIEHLPNQQLLGQHRECCALRGAGWGRPHSTVNYVFKNPYYKLYYFHLRVMNEMIKRGYEPNIRWFFPYHRGKKVGNDITGFSQIPKLDRYYPYNEHDDMYYVSCINNLKRKGITLNV
jgi:uncharacterized protein (TIGR02328 family)